MANKQLFQILLFAIFFGTNIPYCFSQKRNLDYLPVISNRQDFDDLKGKPLSENYNGIECIKVVYEIATKKIFYIESVKYKWHYLFTSKILNDYDDLEHYNIINYGQNHNRKYILATFNYNINTNNYFLQFAPPDDISEELISTLVNKISETFYKKNNFKILINTSTLIKRKKELEKKFEIVTSGELYKNQNYQPIFCGKTNGILTFLDADSINQYKDYSNCILIINGNSNNIPICKGILTNEFQTPLSHICLLTANRKTPSAFLKNCYLSDSLRKYNGKPLEMQTSKSKVSIVPVKEISSSLKSKTSIAIKYDTSYKHISYLKSLSFKNTKSFGAKTCNLAELQKLERLNGTIKTPANAFAIPFFFYHKHIVNNGIDSLINKMLNEYTTNHNDSLLNIQLKKIRKKITNSKLDTNLLNQITKLCIKNFGKHKVRFRSSSNCEDGNNFNGAGLYTSKTGIANDSNKTYEKAIKKVWASLWSLRAFKERSYFNIEQTKLLMGVLIHQAIDNELVNGVAITKNLYRDYEAGFVINMQKGEEEIVAPKKSIISEQVISYMNIGSEFYDNSRSADWISYSSLSKNNSLLTTEELFELTKQLESIKRHFYELYKIWQKKEYKEFGMDVEFKLIEQTDKKRQFIIKQARPYLN